MIEVYRNRDSSSIGHLQSILESEGIRTYLRGEHAANTTFPEVTPALCILEEADVENGTGLIRAHIESSSTGPKKSKSARIAVRQTQ